MKRVERHRVACCCRLIGLAIAGSLYAGSARGAFISEIDLASPAGRAIEVSQMDDPAGYTLVIMDGNPFSTAPFGTVLGVVPLSAGLGEDGLVMVSDQDWPGGAVTTVPLASLSPASATGTLNLYFNRLLVLLRGQVDVNLLDRPVTQNSAYDSSAVEDWLVLGSGLSSEMYVNSGHNLAQINASLGIDLLSRVVDTGEGSVIGRSWLLGEPMNLETFHIGIPDPAKQFEASVASHLYTYTPGQDNLALTPIHQNPSLSGDTDGDGDVDDSDLGTAFANYTGPVGPAGEKLVSQGDTDTDGDVDDSDLGSAFSAYSGPLAPGTAVPEPSSLGVLLFGSVFVLFKRKRDCSSRLTRL